MLTKIVYTSIVACLLGEIVTKQLLNGNISYVHADDDSSSTDDVEIDNIYALDDVDELRNIRITINTL